MLLLEFPFFVALWLDNRHACGGSIITKDWVNDCTNLKVLLAIPSSDCLMIGLVTCTVQYRIYCITFLNLIKAICSDRCSLYSVIVQKCQPLESTDWCFKCRRSSYCGLDTARNTQNWNKNNYLSSRLGFTNLSS